MSKRFGYLFADEMEYKPFRELALKNGGAEVPDAPLPLVRYDVDGAEIFAVQSGIGKVNAAFAATYLVLEKKVDALLSAGLSGAISHLRKGDVIAGETYVECDFDLRVFDYPL
ncbi:MAG: hypothetical protein IJ133_03030, partial [Clostridia bacterium]|nr:hypothetical protein [Clostridia bacterium]